MPRPGSAVARVKRTLTQRNFTLGELKEDFLEGDDLEARQQAMRSGLNTRITTARSVKARGGTRWRRTLGTANDVVEIRPGPGLIFGLIVNNTSLDIIDENADIVHSEASVPWSDATSVWIEPFREQTVIGGPWGLYILTYGSGLWSFDPFAYELAAGGEKAQPYWAFIKDATIQPSAQTGYVTITASLPIWSVEYVGQRIRYGQREIDITDYVSPTVIKGNVISRLPPTYNITVTDGTNFRVGDAVIGNDTNYHGLIVAIATNVLTVVSSEFYDGPDVGEDLSSPSGSSAVTVKTLMSPAASPVWDEPLMSPIRGYPGAGSSVAGRLILVDFPEVPDLVACSSTRYIIDFSVGARDDDAITRQVGDNAPRFLHVVNAGDVLLFSDRGLYYVPVRDNGILSPSTFNAVRFDTRASSSIRPVQVEDGVVFVEASGETISAALLDGNIYLKWSVRPISNNHSHLIRTPRKLCGPSLFAEAPEKYLHVVNSDGTVATISWFSDFQQEGVGFVPWETQGSYVSVSPIFGGYWHIVDRTINGTTYRFLEEQDDTSFLDCSVYAASQEMLDVNLDTLQVNGADLIVVTPGATPFAGETVHVYGAGFYGGTTTVDGAGEVVDNGSVTEDSEVGFHFDSIVSPFPVEMIESPRAGMLQARLIRVSVSLLGTVTFQCRTNNTTRTIEGYGVGDDLSAAPPEKTAVYRFSVFGNRDHPEVEFIKHQPGPFHVLAITQEVQA